MTYAALLFVLIATPAPDSDSSSNNNAARNATSASRGEPVLLNFTTTWCGYCKQMKPALAQLAAAGYPIRDVDGDQSPDLAKRYKISGYPTYVIVDESGEELSRTSGVRPATELASMYREAQGEVRGRRKAQLVADRREDADEENDNAPAEQTRPAKRYKNPNPWETVVRIRMKLSGNAEGVGSGTVIYSSANESIILTCAHIFKEEGRATPKPAQFRKPIQVDLFDGQLSGPTQKQVHFVETIAGECIDYDLVNDVGLIRVRPGKVLPAARVVPPHWQPEVGFSMMTVGCSEGKDATAWSTKILRTNARLKNTGSGETFFVTECEFAPKQGRSGGGLFTDDGYVAGVCDFADPQHGHGLYAVPQSIYKILDRNKLVALYKPTRDKNEPQRMLADSGSGTRRPKSEGTYRSQSPDGEEPDVPPPSRFGIRPPVVVDNDLEAESAANTKAASNSKWTKPPQGSQPSARMAANRTPSAAGNVAVPSRMTRDDDAAPAEEAEAAAPAVNAEDTPAPAASQGGTMNWKPVRRN